MHGGNIRGLTEKYNLKDKGFIDFSSNINPLGFPKGLKKIIADNLESISYYPDIESKVIKNALFRHLNIHTDNLLIGNGSIELIFLITQALIPKKALIPIPNFSEYERALNLARTNNIFLKLSEKNNFQLNLDEVLIRLSGVNLIFLSNPNNPTGALIDKASMEILIKECEKRKVFLVIDEAFMDFVQGGDRISMLESAVRSKYVLVLQSMTKFFALAGLRLGFLAGEKKLIKKITSYQPPWSVNSLAQAAGARVIQDTFFIKKSREYLFKERKYLFRELRAIDSLKTYTPNSNFIFCKILNKKTNSTSLFDSCARKGIFIRDCSNFRGLNNSFIRVAIRKRDENNKLIKTLKEILP